VFQFQSGAIESAPNRVKFFLKRPFQFQSGAIEREGFVGDLGE